jgi:hypothetical protein
MLIYKIIYRFRNDLSGSQEVLIGADHIDDAICEFRKDHANEFELPEIELIEYLGVAINLHKPR